MMQKQFASHPQIPPFHSGLWEWLDSVLLILHVIKSLSIDPETNSPASSVIAKDVMFSVTAQNNILFNVYTNTS